MANTASSFLYFAHILASDVSVSHAVVLIFVFVFDSVNNELIFGFNFCPIVLKSAPVWYLSTPSSFVIVV